jgi:16S rRNA (guanine527-N7)-methyltransferase
MKSSSTPDLSYDRAIALAEHNVSRETISRLDAFVALLLEWQATTNLIAPSTIREVWSRHVADSLQLLKHAPHANTWLDLGSGGGFPGMVIACALMEPGQVHLVESNAKKAAFLREAARITGAPAKIHAVRVENFPQFYAGKPDIVTARALAPLPKLLGYVAPFMERGAQALLLKGQDVDGELTEAAKYWRISADLVPSETDASGRILIVKALQRLT